MINKNIFRKYDVRGIFPDDLTEISVYKIAVAFGKYIKDKKLNKYNKIAIGYDSRLSSPFIFNQLLKGFSSENFITLNLGLSPTPMVYFATNILNVDASIMITGSHNPKNYNGLKITLNKKPFFDNQIQELLSIIEEHNIDDYNDSLLEEKIDINNNYLETILVKNGNANMDNLDYNIAIDAANGATGLITDLIGKKINKIHPIFTMPDGNFPFHHPDPSEEKNLKDLKDYMIKNDIKLGIMFDGDGDRVGFIDEKLNTINANVMIAIFAKDIILKSTNKKIVLDIKCSNEMLKFLESFGAEIIISKTGHPYIKDAIKKNGAIFGAEMSGHVFFNDNYFGFDDGIFAAIRMISILNQNKTTLSNIASQIPIFYTTEEISFQVSDDKKFLLIDKIKLFLQENKINFIDIDGVKVFNQFGSWLIRASNTMPKVMLICSSGDKNGLEANISYAKNIINQLYINN